VRRHDRLRALAGGKIASQRHALDPTPGIVRNLELKRRAGMIVPGLGRIDPVPVRALAARQQKIDRGRCRAPAFDGPRVTKRLAEMPALGMRLEIEQADHLGGGRHRGTFIEQFENNWRLSLEFRIC